MTVPRLRAPIVLVHGIMGFGRVKLGERTLMTYFPGIVEVIEKPGNRVLVPSLTPTGAILDRARQLKDFIRRESPDTPVHLIAHSMGGLDSRAMISSLDMADRVLSLTTLGTPHRGSSFADWGTSRLGRVLTPAFDFFDIPTQGYYDLTRAKCQAFNDVTPDAPRVFYHSVGGRHKSSLRSPEWLASQPIVEREEGECDGVVSLTSAQWGASFEVWEADHFGLVNWPGSGRGLGYDQTERYGSILRRLVENDTEKNLP